MFMGEYSHSIDSKGRLIMPAKYRDELGKEFVMTKGADSCISVYPMEEWRNIEGRVREMSMNSKEGRRFMRIFFSSASLCELDKQGRVLIPLALREHASLGKDVTLIGNVTRVEIWSKDQWDAYQGEACIDEGIDFVSEQGLIF